MGHISQWGILAFLHPFSLPVEHIPCSPISYTWIPHSLRNTLSFVHERLPRRKALLRAAAPVTCAHLMERSQGTTARPLPASPSQADRSARNGLFSASPPKPTR